MKNQKNEFNLSNYEFRVVKMDVFSKNGDTKQNKFSYYLLVDGNNFIHDYKFQFSKLFITKYTTNSHNKAILSKKLIKRHEILNIVGLKNEFWDSEKRKPYTEIEYDKISRLNQWILNQSWKEITFQNIEYILTGSNPSGQGCAKGYLKTEYNGNSYCFGFFFQKLNISKIIEHKYKNVCYKEVWNQYFMHKNIDEVEFNVWIEQQNLLEYFKQYIFNSKNWKLINKEFETALNRSKEEFKNLDDKIMILRRKYKEEINKKYQRIENTCGSITNYFFKDANTTNYQRAHIKPVYQIRKEYLSTMDESILNQIADSNNFLPLSPNVHALYDQKYFYWTTSGQLIKIKDYIADDIVGFHQISQEAIINIKKYLNEYINLVL